jgi:hypothetical protein
MGQKPLGGLGAIVIDEMSNNNFDKKFPKKNPFCQQIISHED